MKIFLNNVGIIKQSSVLLEGLTVVTGANNSGKSTIGKSAYALVKGTEDLADHAVMDRYFYAVDKLKELCNLFPFFFKRTLKKHAESVHPALITLFTDQKELKKLDPVDIDAFLSQVMAGLYQLGYSDITDKADLWTSLVSSDYTQENFEQDKGRAISFARQIEDRINNDPTLEKYLKESLRTQLNLEFSNQVAPVKKPSSDVLIEMFDGEKKCYHISLREGCIIDDGKPLFLQSPYRNVFFIDDPYVIEDECSFRRDDISNNGDSFFNSKIVLSHRDELKYELRNMQKDNVWEKVQIRENLAHIKKMMDEVLPGTFVSEQGKEYYKDTDGTKLDVANLATGSKMFAVMKMLLESGEIDERTLLVLDEPECHLHPSWQNKFAEIVVMLVKEIGCHVLLTTHSQNFMLALDTCTRKYSIRDKSNFYQAKKQEDGFVEYENVNDSLKSIYSDFLRSFSAMKRVYDECVADEDYL